MQQLTLPLKSSDLQIRRSPRAKRLRVSISPVGEIEVVAPRNASTHDVQYFIQSQYEWISKRKLQIEAIRNTELNATMPSRVLLPAINEHWKVIYDTGSTNSENSQKHVTTNDVLSLTIENETQAQQLLKQWLTHRAVSTLLPWLKRTSDETGLCYSSASVRGQKTRWASCSSRKNISLNRCMLFLNPEQVRYLFVHELCHTREMNHTAKFWRLVGQFVPDYKRQEQLVNKSCFQLPRWAF